MIVIGEVVWLFEVLFGMLGILDMLKLFFMWCYRMLIVFILNLYLIFFIYYFRVVFFVNNFFREVKFVFGDIVFYCGGRRRGFCLGVYIEE